MRLSILMVFGMTLFGVACKAIPQNDHTTATFDSAVMAHDFSFSPTIAQPMGGSQVNLTLGYYSIKFSNDSLIVFMPYYGRAYMAPTNPSDGGYRLATKAFDMQLLSSKKGLRSFMIVPKERTLNNMPQDIQSIRLDVGINGYGSAQINSFSKQPISFYGNYSANPHQ